MGLTPSAVPLRRSEGLGTNILFVALLLFLCYWLLFPVWSLAARSLADESGGFAGLANFAAVFRTPGLSQAIWHTLLMGAVTVLLTVGCAFVVAYGLTRARVAAARLAGAVCLLPLFAPSLFPCVGLVYLFGGQGVAKALLCGADIYGPVGIILGSVLFCLPHAVVLLMTTLRSIDPGLHEAARTLGVGPWRRFCTITLPHARYGLISAALVVFILTITDFGVPKVLGGNYSMLSTEIYKQVIGLQNFGLGASVSLVLMLPSLAAFLLDSWARKKQSGLFGPGRQRPVVRRAARDAALSLAVWSVLGAQLAVFGMVVFGSFVSFWPYDLSFTLANYDFSLQGADFAPFCTSLLLALGVALAGSALMFVGAYCVARCSLPRAMTGLYRVLALLPLSIPGTVLGLAYIFAFNRPGNWYELLHGSLPLLVLNTVVHFYTVGHLTFAASLQALNPHYETVGFTVGVPRSVTFFRVILPLSGRTLLDTALYLFVNALTTISAVVFLYTPETMPASVFMLQVNDTGNTAAAAAIGTLLLLLAFAARLLYTLLLRLGERKGLV